MPRSPNRHRSPSSRDRNNKRDYRQSRKDSEDRYYHNQSRKKVHRNDYYEDEPRQRSRRPLDDDNRSKRKQSYEQRPNIILEEKQLYNKPKRSQPESQIKVHFRFKPIKVKLQPQHEQEILKLLKTHVSKKQSPVQHFQKSVESRPGYLVIEFGFRYDSDAFSYLKDKFSEIDLTIQKEKHNITAQPTKTFKLLIDQMEEKKKKTGGRSRSGSKEDKRVGANKQRERQKQRPSKRSGKKRRHSSSQSGSYSSSKSSSSSSSRSRRSSRRSKDRRQDRQSRKQYRNDNKDRSKGRQRQRERQLRRRSQQNNGRRQIIPSSKFDIIPPVTSTQFFKQVQQQTRGQKRYKTLYFFGIHFSVNLKDMDNLFYTHQLGPFKHQQFIMRRMKNSICEYMQGRFEEKDANKILQISEKLQVKGHPFIVIESQSGEPQKILGKLSEFQVNLQFPQKIEPYYMLKWLKQCGRVMQIITLNKLTGQGLSEYYNITLNSKSICDQLKELRHKQICVQQVTLDNVINVYRPNYKTQLIPIESSNGSNNRYENNENGKNSSYQQSSNKDKEQQSSNKERSGTTSVNANTDNKDYRSHQSQY